MPVEVLHEEITFSLNNFSTRTSQQSTVHDYYQALEEDFRISSIDFMFGIDDSAGTWLATGNAGRGPFSIFLCDSQITAVELDEALESGAPLHSRANDTREMNTRRYHWICDLNPDFSLATGRKKINQTFRTGSVDGGWIWLIRNWSATSGPASGQPAVQGFAKIYGVWTE